MCARSGRCEAIADEAEQVIENNLNGRTVVPDIVLPSSLLEAVTGRKQKQLEGSRMRRNRELLAVSRLLTTPWLMLSPARRTHLFAPLNLRALRFLLGSVDILMPEN
jgi:hypothetical protein